ncbi:hypothetical protein SeMB42_g07330 [Synchytrium endobioticum]|uniref:Uncharacterized protein n=1 Tax=Synchytrium endobioticum TaxID=286115 RepID=A0A507C4L0_9FUNG|nr:hypothetical protein SeMB42_g07330 [Synchytrium endobioticum]
MPALLGLLSATLPLQLAWRGFMVKAMVPGDNIVGMLLGVQDSTNKYFPMDVPTTGNFQLCSGTAPGTNQAITHKAANSGLTTLPLTMTVPAGTTGPLTVTALVVGNSAAGQGWNVVSVTIPAGAGTGAGAATGATGNNGTVAPRPTQVVTTLFPSPNVTPPPPPPPGTQTIPAAKLEAKSTKTDSVFHGLPDPSLSTAAANVDNNKIAGKSSTLAPKPPAPPSTNGGPAAIKPQKQSNPTTSAPKPPAPQSTNGGPAAIKPQKQSKPTTSAPKPPAPQSTNGGAAAIKPQTLNGVDVPQNVVRRNRTRRQSWETLPTPSPKPSFVPKADNKKLPDAKKKVTAEEKKAKDDAKKKLAAGEKKAKSTHKASPRPQNKTPRATNTKPSKARATGK